jgi:formylglycine-generating enzyme required for sulfatase activity
LSVSQDTAGEFAAGPLKPGVVVDGCRLEAMVGSGGFGAVYRAHHLLLDHPRALKFLQPRGGLTESAKARFLAEARHTARLAHPNVVVVHNVGEFRGLPFIHMEYLQGSSLRSRVRQGAAPAGWVLAVVDQVLAGLAAAHARGLVHRDVKPDNVMLLDGDTVKVVDFGLSLNVEAQVSRLTAQSGQVLGTPLYMAPEQWRSTSVGPPADVWSAGVLLYELLAGVPPFQSGSLIELAEQIRSAAHVPLRHRAAVSRTLSDAVDRMLAKSPRDRDADAAEARAALRAAAAIAAAAAPAFLPETMCTVVPAEVPAVEGLTPLPGADGPPRAQRDCDGAVMVLLPGGEFFMGSDAGDTDERPRHRVRLSPFLLDAAPVSRRQFATFLSLWGSDRDDAGHVLLDPLLAGLERAGMTWEPDGEEDAPVTGVSWYGARAYAQWAGTALPSEAQLEYAFARLGQAATEELLPWQRLLGAVRLWCVDTYDERFYARPGSSSRPCDPVNEAADAFVVIRGRSRLRPQSWSPSQRHFGTRHETVLDVGFCCVRGALP